MPLISERVELARLGKLPAVVSRVASGWVVMGDAQFLPGYCQLWPDPVVPSLNDLSPTARATYLEDMAAVGDAVLSVTGAVRVNYEILCNVVPELHAHVFPRYANEPAELREKPVWFYDWDAAVKFSEEKHGELRKQLQAALSRIE